MDRALRGLARPTRVRLAATFLAFRPLDPAKPGPIGWAGRQAGAAGVTADDPIGGALAAGVPSAAGTRWLRAFG